jgi:hypothetical protein
MDLDFEGHGAGKFIIPRFARRAARKQLPRNLQNLKDILEHGG